MHSISLTPKEFPEDLDIGRLNQYMDRIFESYYTFLHQSYFRKECNNRTYEYKKQALQDLKRKTNRLFEYLEQYQEKTYPFYYKELHLDLKLFLEEFLVLAVTYYRLDLPYPDFDLEGFFTRSFQLDFVSSSFNELERFFCADS